MHGRLLRILLSSILFRSLDHMSYFTHHNTCVNVIDIIIERNPRNFTNEPLIDKFGLVEHSQKSLDDSIEIHNCDLNSARNIDPPKLDFKPLVHPTNVKFIPIALDDRRHLVELGNHISGIQSKEQSKLL